jgi:hypothetical protein
LTTIFKIHLIAHVKLYHLLSRMTPRSLLHAGVHKPERQVAMTAEFRTVVPNIIDFLVWNSSGAFSFEVAYTLGEGGGGFVHPCSKVYCLMKLKEWKV